MHRFDMQFLLAVAMGATVVDVRMGFGVPYFLGLRPLAGYTSLKLCHVMSCFLYEKRILCYDMAG